MLKNREFINSRYAAACTPPAAGSSGTESAATAVPKGPATTVVPAIAADEESQVKVFHNALCKALEAVDKDAEEAGDQMLQHSSALLAVDWDVHRQSFRGLVVAPADETAGFQTAMYERIPADDKVDIDDYIEELADGIKQGDAPKAPDHDYTDIEMEQRPEGVPEAGSGTERAATGGGES